MPNTPSANQFCFVQNLKHFRLNRKPSGWAIGIVSLCLLCYGIPAHPQSATVPQPRKIIDLGILVTEEQPESLWGKRMLSDMGFDRSNTFDVINWEYADGAVSGSNSYFTLFNHGGPHVDAPNHVGLGGGLDTYDVDAFVGPLKVFDASEYQPGRSVPAELFEARDIEPGDVVVMYTSYAPPQDDDYPEVISLTREAAEYLSQIPVRAFGTDGWGVDSLTDQSPVSTDSALVQAAPIHHSFLSQGIPVVESLVNVEILLDERSLYFVGVPLNIKDGDGMMVRPVVLIY